MRILGRKITLSGVVQGVGFRPFIYRHARLNQLDGWVLNSSGRVEVHIQGDVQRLEQFEHTLIESAPGLSRPVIESVEEADCLEINGFQICFYELKKNQHVKRLRNLSVSLFKTILLVNILYIIM